MEGDRIIDPGQVVTQAVLAEILAERGRQVSLGHSAVSDDAYVERELARAGGAYALCASGHASADLFYPWPGHVWSDDPRLNLIRGAALVVAEIERLDRLTGAAS